MFSGTASDLRGDGRDDKSQEGDDQRQHQGVHRQNAQRPQEALTAEPGWQERIDGLDQGQQNVGQNRTCEKGQQRPASHVDQDHDQQAQDGKQDAPRARRSEPPHHRTLMFIVRIRPLCQIRV
jgi:hypothetical protein